MISWLILPSLVEYEKIFRAAQKNSETGHHALPPWTNGANWADWKKKTIITMTSNHGAWYCSIKYIFNDPKPVGWDPEQDAKNEFEKLMYQLPRSGVNYDSDNEKGYVLLAAAFAGTDGESWIRSCQDTRDGARAWLKLLDHFEGTSYEASVKAKAIHVIDSITYTGEQHTPFEKVMAKLTKAYADLSELGQEYQEDLKVRNLHRITGGLQNNAQFMVIREQMYQNHRHNYQAAVDYISERITELFPGAAEARRPGRARRVASQSATINGRHIPDIRNIPGDVWYALTHEEQDTIRRKRAQLGKRGRSFSPGRGRGRGRGRGYGRGRGSARGRGRGYGRGGNSSSNNSSRGGRGTGTNVRQAASAGSNRQPDAPTSNGSNQQQGQSSGRGAQHGVRFGRGTSFRPAEN